MSDDIARLGISVTTTGAKESKADLDALAASAARAKPAVDSLGQSHADAQKDMADLAQTAGQKLNPELNRMSTQASAAFHAMRTMGEGIAIGIPPTQILATQLNHLAYAASGPGGLVSAFKDATKFAVGLISPTVAVAGAVVGVGVAAITAAANWQEAQGKITAALSGIGGASGATVSDINNIAKSIALTGSLSFGDARDAATEIARIGTVGVENIKPLVALSHNLSIVLGSDTTEAAKLAGKAIGDIASGSTEGLVKLNEQVGFLSGTLLDQINNFLKAGNVTQAQAVAIDAIAHSTQGAAQAVTFWGATWQGVKNVGSATINALGDGLTQLTGIGQTLDDQLASLKAQLKFGGADFGFEGGLVSSDDELKKEIADLEKQIALNRQLAEEKRNNLAGLQAQQAANGIAPEFAQLDELEKRLAQVNKALNDPAILKSAGSIDVLTAAHDRLTVAIQNRTNADGSAITADQQQTQVFAAQLQQINARTGAERQAAAAALATANATFSATDKQLAGQRASQIVATQLSAAAKDQLATLEDQYQVVSQITGSGRMRAQQEADINSLMRQGLDYLDAANIADQRRANTQAQIDANVERQITSIRQQTALIEARANGDEASVAAAIAYSNAIDAGASATQAAALAAATLDNYMERAAASAEKAGNAVSNFRNIGAPGSTFAGEQIGVAIQTKAALMTSGSADRFDTFVGFTQDGSDTASSAYLDKTYGPGNWSVEPHLIQGARNVHSIDSIFISKSGYAQYQQQQKQQASQVASSSLQDDVAGALLGGTSPTDLIAQIQSGSLGKGADANTRFEELLDLYKRAGISSEQTIADIKSGVIGKGADNSELLRAIDNLTSSVDGLNSTVLGLSDIYSQGHGAIGYYHAASGLQATVGGPGGVDQTPVHLMLSRGEQLTVTPNGSQQNGGSSSVIINQTVVFQNQTDGAGSRRSQRQVADEMRRAVAAV